MSLLRCNRNRTRYLPFRWISEWQTFCRSSQSFSPHSSITELESLNQNRRLLPHCSNELHVIDGTNKERYFVGLIDFLTTYGVRKRFENLYKGIKYKRSGLTYSTVNPDVYAVRFREFVSSHVLWRMRLVITQWMIVFQLVGKWYYRTVFQY